MNRLIGLVPLAAMPLVLAAFGCEQGSFSGDESDPAAAQTQSDPLWGPPGPRPRTSFYYRARANPTACPAPHCGGFWVQAVNRRQTWCADGSSQPECLVAQLDLASAGLSSDQQQSVLEALDQVLFFGQLRPGAVGLARGQSVLVATQAWQGHPGIVPIGTYYHAERLSIQCIQAPCPDIQESELNTRQQLLILDIDFGSVPGADPVEGQKQLESPEGVLVVGTNEPNPEFPLRDVKVLVATEFFVLLGKTPGPGASCGSRGLAPCPAGQFCDYAPKAQCGQTDAPGSCTVIPEVCPQILDPVCGCDGASYGNACLAHMAGVSVAQKGECAEETRP